MWLKNNSPETSFDSLQGLHRAEEALQWMQLGQSESMEFPQKTKEGLGFSSVSWGNKVSLPCRSRCLQKQQAKMSTDLQLVTNMARYWSLKSCCWQSMQHVVRHPGQLKMASVFLPCLCWATQFSSRSSSSGSKNSASFSCQSTASHADAGVYIFTSWMWGFQKTWQQCRATRSRL